jgi:hypothetical protein
MILCLLVCVWASRSDSSYFSSRLKNGYFVIEYFVIRICCLLAYFFPFHVTCCSFHQTTNIWQNVWFKTLHWDDPVNSSMVFDFIRPKWRSLNWFIRCAISWNQCFFLRQEKTTPTLPPNKTPLQKTCNVSCLQIPNKCGIDVRRRFGVGDRHLSGWENTRTTFCGVRVAHDRPWPGMCPLYFSGSSLVTGRNFLPSFPFRKNII